MSTYLESILAHHRARAKEDSRSFEALYERAAAAPAARSFAAALRAERELSVIAEVKRRSPSAGEIWGDLNPAALGAAYAEGGASALSVLTDMPHFGGSPEDLAAARASAGVPVLRKDFTVDPRDVCDARLMEADAVLLIVSALSDVELSELLSLTEELGMDALVEAHDAEEIHRAGAAGARLIGVNQRDLRTFEVDRRRAARLAALLPADALSVAESGIIGGEDAEAAAEAGYDAVLVGESLLRKRGTAHLAASIAELRVLGS